MTNATICQHDRHCHLCALLNTGTRGVDGIDLIGVERKQAVTLMQVCRFVSARKHELAGIFAEGRSLCMEPRLILGAPV